MALIDRREVLARTDLAALADDVCGPPRGRGRSARWHCPSPDHPDRTPSMGLYTTTAGEQRWKCHACGEGGSAVDLLMVATGMGAGEALRDLAARAGLPTAGPGTPAGPSTGLTASRRFAAPPALATPTLTTPTTPTTTSGLAVPGAVHGLAVAGFTAAVGEPDPAIEALVAAAADLLWQPVGRLARRHLAQRGLPEDLLRANRIGFDPGPALLARPPGLPRRGPGIVFPALDPLTGAATYYQVRALSPDIAAERKYDQPTSARAPNPRLVAVRAAPYPHTIPSTDPASDPASGPIWDRAADVTIGTLPLPAGSMVAICEGFPDALTATLTGLPALALLGISHAGRDGVDQLAARILSEHPAAAYAVCFDNEPNAGHLALRLADRLARHGATALRLQPPPGIKDLNLWWQTRPDELTQQLRSIPNWPSWPGEPGLDAATLSPAVSLPPPGLGSADA